MPAGYEHWRPVVGFPGYFVSHLGRVKSMRYSVPRILAVSFNRDGYHRVRLYRGDNRPKYMFVHTLVLTAFLGERPPGMESRHLDDNKDDNRLANLDWGTRSQNIYDAVANGKQYQARKTHCPAGHPYAGPNLRTRSDGARTCRACERNRNRRRTRSA